MIFSVFIDILSADGINCSLMIDTQMSSKRIDLRLFRTRSVALANFAAGEMGCDDELVFVYLSLDSYRREKNPTGVVTGFTPFSLLEMIIHMIKLINNENLCEASYYSIINNLSLLLFFLVFIINFG